MARRKPNTINKSLYWTLLAVAGTIFVVQYLWGMYMNPMSESE